MASDYLTSNELKATLELTGESFADDDIELAITAASRAIDNLTGRRFYADSDANQVRYYSPTDPDVLWVDDLVTLTTLEVDTGEDGTFEETWTANTDFYLEPLNAAADGWPYTFLVVNTRSSVYFPVAHRSVKVTGKFGWSVVPDAVKQAAKISAAKLLKRSREAPFGVVGFGADGVAVRIGSNDPDVMTLLSPFIRENMA